MESLFKGYYQPTPEQFKELWEEGTFVFDTNVLLGLYRYKRDSRDEVLNVIKKIEDRIWIPYQVGLEFHRNRLTVLGEQNSSLSTIKNSIRESISSIEKKCKDLELDKRHSEIETATFIERFRDLSESVISELDEIKAKKLTNDIDQDVVLTELTTLFSVSKGSLGSPPKDQKVLEDIYKDGEFRAKNKIPPSFEDILKAQKNKSGEEYYAFEGLNYKKGFGDLIVWKQIIEFARTNEKKKVIFVTDDTKEDWMRIINSHGKNTISARPELVSEIFKEAGVETFYIYDTNSFLDYSKEYFDIEVSDETIKDVKSVYYKYKMDIIEDSAKAHDSIFDNVIRHSNDLFQKKVLSTQYDKSISYWLHNRYMGVLQVDNDNIFSYIGLGFNATETPVSISFIDLDKFSLELINYKILKNISSFANINRIKEKGYSNFHIALFFYTSDKNIDFSLFDRIDYENLENELIENLNIDYEVLLSIGLLDTSHNNINIINEIKIFNE